MKKLLLSFMSIALLSFNLFAYELVPYECGGYNSDGSPKISFKHVDTSNHYQDYLNSVIREKVKRVNIDGLTYEYNEWNVDDRLYLYQLEDISNNLNISYSIVKEDNDITRVTLLKDNKTYEFTYRTSSGKNRIYSPWATQEEKNKYEEKDNNKLIKNATDKEGNEFKVAMNDGKLYTELRFDELSKRIK